MIIGISGKKYSGKDTIADHIVKKFGFVKISFGDTLKKALKVIFNFNDEQLYGNKKEVVDNYWKVSPREMMQYVGTDLFRNKMKADYPNICDNIWILSVQKQIELLNAAGKSNIVISDVRFENEYNMIRSAEGKIIHVVRNNIVNSDVHESENSINDTFEFDYTVRNNTLEELYSNIDTFVNIHMQ